MFNTRNELLNLMGILSPMGLVFLDPDGVIGQDDLANHNRAYIGFEYGQSAVIEGFGGHMMNCYDDEED